MIAAEQEAPPMGHNNPPPPTPYEAFKAHIDDLAFEARNFLDGEPVETEAQATAVSRILNDARTARTDADAQRKLEAKPFDEGKAAVQALWTPLTDEKKGRCALIVATCKQALAPWLVKVEEKLAADAAILRENAEKLASAAATAHQAGNLDAAEQAEALLEAAGEALKEADRADKQKAHAKGGERAVGLRSVWTPTLTDSCQALKYYREHQPEALKSWLVEQAEKDVRAGARSIPGFDVTEARVAV